MCGYLTEAIEFSREGEDLTGDDLQLGREAFGFSYLVWFIVMRAWMLSAQGRAEESLREYVRGLRLARESGIPENLGWAQGNLATLAEMTGSLFFDELGDVRAAALDGLRIAEELGSAFSRALALSSVGAASALAGEWEEAEPLLVESLEMIRSRRTGLEFEALTLSRLARARLGAGNAQAARLDAEEAVAIAAERDQRYTEVWAQLTLASALCEEQGTKARAAIEKALERAGALVDEIGARVFEPQILHARARLEQVCGDPLSADRYLREALRKYGEVGAAGHARRVEQALAAGA
jgi:tetratricopeptide (TPR) repeat protein